MSCVITGCEINAGGSGIATTSVVTGAILSGNRIAAGGSAIAVGGSGQNHFVIQGNILDAGDDGILMGGNASFYQISHNVISDAGRHGMWLQGTQQGVIAGNVINTPADHGIYLDDVDDTEVFGNLIVSPGGGTANSFDGIFLEDDSDSNHIHGNKIIPNPVTDTRSAINVSTVDCDCNVIVGNSLGEASLYGTDALLDAGTDTQLFYPADAVYGDNFTCPPVS